MMPRPEQGDCVLALLPVCVPVTFFLSGIVVLMVLWNDDSNNGSD